MTEKSIANIAKRTRSLKQFQPMTCCNQQSLYTRATHKVFIVNIIFGKVDATAVNPG
jgi:hypothetical protein